VTLWLSRDHRGRLVHSPSPPSADPARQRHFTREARADLPNASSRTVRRQAARARRAALTTATETHDTTHDH